MISHIMTSSDHLDATGDEYFHHWLVFINNYVLKWFQTQLGSFRGGSELKEINCHDRTYQWRRSGMLNLWIMISMMIMMMTAISISIIISDNGKLSLMIEIMMRTRMKSMIKCTIHVDYKTERYHSTRTLVRHLRRPITLYLLSQKVRISGPFPLWILISIQLIYISIQFYTQPEVMDMNLVVFEPCWEDHHMVALHCIGTANRAGIYRTTWIMLWW